LRSPMQDDEQESEGLTQYGYGYYRKANEILIEEEIGKKMPSY